MKILKNERQINKEKKMNNKYITWIELSMHIKPY